MMKYIAGLSCFFFLSFLSAQVTFIVDKLPDNTPEDAQIYLAGDINNWNEGNSDYILVEHPFSGRYHLTVDNLSGNIQFKFTRGTWTAVEGNADGGFIPNRSYTVATGDTLILQIEGWEDLDGGGDPNSTAADNVTILSNAFYIPQLDRFRRIWVYLPPDYDNSTKEYPVIYMHDGQNVFDAVTSGFGEWEVDETLNQLHAEGDYGAIVVAIDNGGLNRLNEYSPWVHPTYGGGQGEAYINFIVNTLKPHIDGLYRTRPERDYTAIIGSSMGGLISTYAGLAHQDVFSKIGAFSPAYWFSDESLEQPGEVGMEETLRIFQLVGTAEGSTYVADMYAMENELIAAGFDEDEILSVEEGDGQHSEWFWAREFGDAYKWLFTDLLTDIAEEEALEASFEIFPNPVSNELSVSFSLQQSAAVQLQLVAIDGSFSHTLFFKDLPAGEHQYSYLLKQYGLAAGLYQTVLRVSDKQFVKELVLVD